MKIAIVKGVNLYDLPVLPHDPPRWKRPKKARTASDLKRQHGYNIARARRNHLPNYAKVFLCIGRDWQEANQIRMAVLDKNEDLSKPQVKQGLTYCVLKGMVDSRPKYLVVKDGYTADNVISAFLANKLSTKIGHVIYEYRRITDELKLSQSGIAKSLHGNGWKRKKEAKKSDGRKRLRALTDEQVQELRRIYPFTSWTALEEIFGCDKETISRALNGEGPYRNIPPGENEEWWARLGSNQRPLPCQDSATTTELRAPDNQFQTSNNQFQKGAPSRRPVEW